MNNFLKNKNNRIIIWVVALVAVALFFWLTWPKPDVETQPSASTNSAIQTGNTNTVINANVPKTKTPVIKPAAKPVSFVEKKTPHFVAATIANNATLTQTPTDLTIKFNALILKTSQSIIMVKKNDITSVTLNPSSIQGDNMTVKLNPDVTDGDYYVYYVACFADTACSDGRFGYHLKLP
jgi:methionine-rich copper-binding protein CopC